MRISGVGITGYKTLKIQRDFTVDTQYALKWAQLANGAWTATDRGESEDVYMTTITVTSIESPIGEVDYTLNSLLTDLYANRLYVGAGANEILIDDIPADSHDQMIFGCDIDYSAGITAKVLEIGQRKQASLHRFTVDITLIAKRPLSFAYTYTPADIVFDHIDIGYRADVEYTFAQTQVYAGNPHTMDERYDSGIIEFVATIPIVSRPPNYSMCMGDFRRTIANIRGATSNSTTLRGVRYGFGPTKDATWPKYLKYLEVKDLGIWGQHYYRVQCKCVEDI